MPINTPMVMFDRKGRAYVEQGLLTSHWSLFLPDRSENSPHVDTIASRETCRRLLGIRRLAPVTAAVGSSPIATRAFEYLQQHPYVEQLKINVFNPGDGQLITDACHSCLLKHVSIFFWFDCCFHKSILHHNSLSTLHLRASSSPLPARHAPSLNCRCSVGATF